jgi:UDPglucose 6-dehydrogenase
VEITITGTGYVGLPAGAGLASQGHQVTCVDIDEEKVKDINSGNSPIYEEGLEELLSTVVDDGRLSATTDTAAAVEEADVVLLAVGTPMEEDGSIDISYIRKAAEDVGEAMAGSDGYKVVAVKSTVVPTTTEKEIIPVLEEHSGKEAGEDFGVCMNPEFLREGTALDDFLDPDRIVIGELDEQSGDTLERLYDEWDAPVIRTSLRAAELIKYASNSLLATKISFINEIGNLCKELGIDVYEVADGVGLDSRINRDFLDSGDGWGGSCFPKDVRALISFMQKHDKGARILESVVEVNKEQKTKLVDLLGTRIDTIDGKTISVLGLAFKPGTDDVRKSPAIPIIQQLKEKGASVKAYDPEAMENMREKHDPDIEYCESYERALDGSDAALIVTDWDEFDEISRSDIKSMNNQLVLEGMKTDHELPDEKTEGVTWP